MAALLSRYWVYTWRRSLNNVIILRCVLSGKEGVWWADNDRNIWLASERPRAYRSSNADQFTKPRREIRHRLPAHEEKTHNRVTDHDKFVP
jgi:hypothetical protein